jgi:demethylmenaquinone methyltransferase/2-methoxy-6-polyprenyl-1,4-benzoquinol methylase
MLVKSQVKPARGGMPLPIAEADAERLPFFESAFRFATVAFGLRNVEFPEKALAEMLRVLEPGGTGIVLEFARPVVPVFAWLFDFYFVRVLPWIGRVVSGVDGPYRYLPESVKKFPAQREFSRLMEEVGFVDVGHVNLTGGVAALYSGRKPEGSISVRV